MRPCTAILGLVLAPLAFGCLLGIAIANSVLVALEDARRERRERVARVTPEEAELRYLIFDTHERGPVIEVVYDGGLQALDAGPYWGNSPGLVN